MIRGGPSQHLVWLMSRYEPPPSGTGAAVQNPAVIELFNCGTPWTTQAMRTIVGEWCAAHLFGERWRQRTYS